MESRVLRALAGFPLAREESRALASAKVALPWEEVLPLAVRWSRADRARRTARYVRRTLAGDVLAEVRQAEDEAFWSAPGMDLTGERVRVKGGAGLNDSFRHEQWCPSLGAAMYEVECHLEALDYDVLCRLIP